MDEWSALFTVAAIAGVLLMFLGAWWMVRTLRARRPTPKMTDREDSRPAGRSR